MFRVDPYLLRGEQVAPRTGALARTLCPLPLRGTRWQSAFVVLHMIIQPEPQVLGVAVLLGDALRPYLAPGDPIAVVAPIVSRNLLVVANGAIPVPVAKKNNFFPDRKASKTSVPVGFLFKMTPSPFFILKHATGP